MRALRTGLALALAIGVVAATSVSAVRAQNDRICLQLWVERNSIYKAGGYCFKTARAISYFGNAGCAYDDERDIPLTRGQRARVAAIQAEERDYGCR